MINISTLWPEWSYSSEAAKQIINPNWHSKIKLETDNLDVVDSVSEWTLWVIPIENKYGWRVEWVSRAIYDKKNTIWIQAWTSLTIDHVLASNWSSIDEIKSVHSHPQALLQCTTKLKQMQWVKQIRTTSTSSHIKDLEDNQAVICSKNTAIDHWLRILDDEFAPEKNETHFIVLSDNKENLCPEIINYSNIVSNRVIWVLHTNHVVWALAEKLALIAHYWINLYFIQSMADWTWEYDYVVVMDDSDNIDNLKNSIRNSWWDLNIL